MLPKKKLERRHTMLAHLKGIRDRITRETPGAVHPAVSDTLEPTVRLAESLGHMTIVGGNDCTPITDAIVMLDMLAADIEEAVSEVNLLYYIFVKDEKTWCVVDALKRAAARGVICRLLVDLALCPSLSQARKDIKAGGIYLNNVRVADENQTLAAEDYIGGNIALLRKGKKNYGVVTLGV